MTPSGLIFFSFLYTGFFYVQYTFHVDCVFDTSTSLFRHTLITCAMMHNYHAICRVKI